jgi:hypothetical protein
MSIRGFSARALSTSAFSAAAPLSACPKLLCSVNAIQSSPNWAPRCANWLKSYFASWLYRVCTW